MFECPIILVPAYGRKYKTATDAVHDYHTGKDFKLMHTGQYCSCRDFEGVEVSIYLGSGSYVNII